MENEVVKNSNDSAVEQPQQQPIIRSVVCLKNRKKIKEFEEVEDCFILDFNPYESLNLSKGSLKQDDHDSELTIVAEKGKVACRDYPHSRHQCAEYPFSKTPHQSHCKLCYCFVCDVTAPCKLWSSHCNAEYISLS